MADRPTVDVERRRFLNRTLIGALGVFSAILGGGSVAFLWPSEPRDRFGAKIVAGKYNSISHELDRDERPIYNPIGKFYLVRYPREPASSFYTEPGVVAGGIMAIYQKCSHLGCRVPYCPTSKFFECPCHDARFNIAGELINGPARAGMWKFPIEISSNGDVVVDTSRPFAQTPSGYHSVSFDPVGKLCVED